MDLQEIDVFIDKNGEVRIEVRGVKGDACLATTKDLENALGGDIAKREMTSEANEGGVAEEQSRQQQSGA